MTQFTNEQIDQIRAWCQEVNSIGDLQTRINKTFNTHLTFLDTRFLMDDFDLQLATHTETPIQKGTAESPLEGELVDTANTVQVSVDPVTRPGMMVNGSVTFSDGQSATWSLDQLGRLGIKPSQSDYHPSAEDITQFQEAVQEKLAEVAQRNTFGL